MVYQTTYFDIMYGVQRKRDKKIKKANKRLLGSIAAKGGFASERLIADKFNRYRIDKEAQYWLRCMGYDPEEIKDLYAHVIPTRISEKKAILYGVSLDKLKEELRYKKSDVQLRVELLYHNTYFVENISVKKANSDADYNQVDKRKVSEYREMWNFDKEIEYWLKLFTGEITPPKALAKRDERRLYMDEMPENIVSKIIQFFQRNKIIVISDTIKGKGSLSANWFMVAKYDRELNETHFAIADINFAMNFFGYGDVRVSEKGNLYIGKITMQRKGGTPDPTKLQFKVKPCQIFEVVSHGA
ncbi:MAG: hypothetical protein RMI51_05055 [Aquificaceae bacterium]|nr:hypothetical protein [Aquificaceae bacterium]